jgi:tetratricopeptide (TPR) repeat protein
MDLGQFQLAVEDFDAVLQMRANFPPCLLNRAIAQAALGNHAAAIIDYTTALDHGAPYTRIYFLRARSHESLGNLEAASKDRAKGLSLVPSDEESWIARGMARLSKDPKGALADFREALKMNPTSLSALQNIVYVTADVLEQYPDSLDSLNRILAIDSRNADALAGRAVLFARQGDRARALADVQKLLRVSKQPIHLFQAACSMALTSSVDPADLQKALTLLSNAVLLDPRLMARSKTDKDLEILRKHPGYENLLKVTATAPKQ